MTVVLKIVAVVSGLVLLGAFFVATVCSLVLPLCLDQEKMKWDATGARSWAMNPLLPMPDVFTPTGVQFWRIRNTCLKVFAVTAGAMALLAVLAAFTDTKLDL